MNQFVTQLREEVSESLHSINNRDEDVLFRASECITLLENAIERLKIFTQAYQFKDEHEEIQFFKEMKPRLSCLLIFYRRMYCIEMNRPKGGHGVQLEYLKKELGKMARFFEENKCYYHYLRSGDCSMDWLYFLRGKPGLNICPHDFYFERDRVFSTNCDFKVSEILANDLLESHLVIEIDRLEASGHSNKDLKEKLTWTGSKVFLVELIYALYLAGVFNHGKASLKRITSYFELMFNIDLGTGISRTFTDIRRRKERTSFLDLLRKFLNDKMNKDDEK